MKKEDKVKIKNDIVIAEDWNELMLYIESLQLINSKYFRLPSPLNFEDCKAYLINKLNNYDR